MDILFQTINVSFHVKKDNIGMNQHNYASNVIHAAELVQMEVSVDAMIVILIYICFLRNKDALFFNTIHSA